MFAALLDSVKPLIGLPTAEESARLAGKKRSPFWPKVRAAYLKTHNVCAASGTTLNLNVHHIEPFHLRPDLELDPANFITLTEEWHSFNAHFVIGHGGENWQNHNPNVRADAKAFRQMLRGVVKNAKPKGSPPDGLAGI